MITVVRRADHIPHAISWASLLSLALLPFAVLLIAAVPVQAVDEEKLEAFRKMRDRELTFLTGQVQLGTYAGLELPSDMTFLASKDAAHVNFHFFGNRSDADSMLGMVLPIEMKEQYESGDRPTEVDPARDWAIIITWVPGHLPVDEALATDPERLMVQIKEVDRRGGNSRPATAISSLNLVGWAEPPTYDAQRHYLTWPLLIRETLHTRYARDPVLKKARGDAPTSQEILNHQVHVLGAAGIITLVTVNTADQTEAIADASQRVVENIAWNAGAEYAAYTPGKHPYYRQGITGMLHGIIEGDPAAAPSGGSSSGSSGGGLGLRFLIPLIIGGCALVFFVLRTFGAVWFAVKTSKPRTSSFNRPITQLAADQRPCAKCQAPVNINAARCPACGASARP